MISRNKFLLSYLLCWCFPLSEATAQGDTIFINQNGQAVSRSEADLYRLVVGYNEADSIYSVRDYFLTGEIEMEGGIWKSATSNVLRGRFVHYYKNGQRKSEGSRKTIKIGRWKYWYRNGQPKAELLHVFEGGDFLDNYEIISCWDSTGNALVEQGTGIFMWYSEMGYLQDSGRVANQLKEGSWVGYRASGDISYQEVYRQGELQRGQSYDTLGHRYQYQELSVQPEYELGMAAFYQYIANHIKYPRKARRKKIQGKVFVSFVVDKKGKLTKVHTIKGIGGGCDRSAEQTLREAPPWVPGQRRGQPVRVRMVLPITFRL